MQHAPLVEVTRGSETESIHYGSVAVVNARGELLYQAGDPHFLTFTRSSLKPFQAVPFLRGGGPAKFGFTPGEIALMCASHSGESVHVETVRSMLQKAGCDERHLRCGCHVPLQYSAFDRKPPAGAVFDQLYNNCSGKHAGFLAYCVQHGQALETYLDPAHPLQQAVRKSVADLAGVNETELRMGIDGCSAPNYALPLSRLAALYARLAQGADDPEYGDVLGGLYLAMTAHPELVSGTGRADLELMRTAPGDWIAKGGAEGVQAIGVRSAGLGIALKVADGGKRGVQAATASVLRQLGLLAKPEQSPLATWIRPPVVNLRGLHTGEVRAAVKLAKTIFG
jgi:L-asparaginase II